MSESDNSIPAGEPALSLPRPPARTVTPPGDVRSVLVASDIEKRFGMTRAVSGCSLELRGGEVHVLMGENGSGKSTMVKILSGVHQPDAGTITVDDARAELDSPRQAMDAGVATVFQEILVAPQRSVLDNVWLGHDGLLRYGITAEQRHERARALLGRLIEPGDLGRPVEQLGLNDRQAVCITRALLRRPRVLILDEATSALDITTRDNLFEVLKELCDDGVAVLFISHRMDEVERIADRVTVMRSGAWVATAFRGEFDSRRLVRLMVGSEYLGDADIGREPEDATQTAGRVARTGDRPSTLLVRGVRLRDGAATIDCEMCAGEIVGVAGLEGHGQHEFLQVLAGSRPAVGEVAIRLDERERVLRSRADAFAAGIAYVPRDRRDEALFPTLSVLENFGLASMAEDRRQGLLSQRATASRFARFVEQMGIVAREPRARITTLSGGNQQKVVIARWLARRPQVLVLDDPTRGVDLGAKDDIYRVLSELSAAGTTVVMLSTELIELMDLMDRVLVFREGAIFRELPQAQLTRSRLVAGYFGRVED